MSSQNQLYIIIIAFLFIGYGYSQEEFMINEIFIGGSEQFPQLIEIYNPSNTSGTLDGWSLYISPNTTQMFVFNETAKLEPGGYYVVTSYDFGYVFMLEHLQKIILSSPTGDYNYSSVIANLHVPTGNVYLPEGRYDEGVPLRFLTPGDKNSYPLVNLIVIQEVYFDAAIDFQYIKLWYNDLYQYYRDPYLYILPPYPISVIIWNDTMSANITFEDFYYAETWKITNQNIGFPDLSTLGDDWNIAIYYENDTLDLFHYNESFWPPGNSTTNISIKRKNTRVYGNDPRNWYIDSVLKQLLSCPINSTCTPGDECVLNQCSTGGSCPYNYDFENCLSILQDTPLTLASNKTYIFDGIALQSPYSFTFVMDIIVDGHHKIFLKYYQLQIGLNLTIIDGVSSRYYSKQVLYSLNINSSIPEDFVNGFLSPRNRLSIIWNREDTLDFSGFYAYYEEIYIGSSCDSNPCSQFCITLNEKDYYCECSSGYSLDKDNKTCIDDTLSDSYQRAIDFDFCKFAIKDPGTCFLDDPFDGILNDGSFSSNDMTPEKCAMYCYLYKYFGVHDSNMCLCGNNYNHSHSQVQGICKSNCAGDSKRICGGVNATAIWQNPYFYDYYQGLVQE